MVSHPSLRVPAASDANGGAGDARHQPTLTADGVGAPHLGEYDLLAQSVVPGEPLRREAPLPPDPYRCLQLHPDAPRPLVEEAYWLLASSVRGDTDGAAAHARIADLNAAYASLVHEDPLAPAPLRPVAVPTSPRGRVGRGNPKRAKAAREPRKRDHYEILLVDRDAQPAIISLAADMLERNAARSRATGEDASAISDARDTLLDPERRAEYDARFAGTSPAHTEQLAAAAAVRQQLEEAGRGSGRLSRFFRAPAAALLASASSRPSRADRDARREPVSDAALAERRIVDASRDLRVTAAEPQSAADAPLAASALEQPARAQTEPPAEVRVLDAARSADPIAAELDADRDEIYAAEPVGPSATTEIAGGSPLADAKAAVGGTADAIAIDVTIVPATTSDDARIVERAPWVPANEAGGPDARSTARDAQFDRAEQRVLGGDGRTPEPITPSAPQRADTPAERRIIDAARAAQARPADSAPEQAAPIVGEVPTTSQERQPPPLEATVPDRRESAPTRPDENPVAARLRAQRYAAGQAHQRADLPPPPPVAELLSSVPGAPSNVEAASPKLRAVPDESNVTQPTAIDEVERRGLFRRLLTRTPESTAPVDAIPAVASNSASTATPRGKEEILGAEHARLMSLRDALFAPIINTASPSDTAAVPAAGRALATLTYVGGPNAGKRFDLDGEPMMIGSAWDAAIVLPDFDGVAAKHARIWKHGDHFVLKHMDGAVTTIDGKPLMLQLVVLDDGDDIGIGANRLRFAELPVAAETEAGRHRTLEFAKIDGIGDRSEGS